MVGRWGMSPAIGFVSVLPAEARGPYGASETSESTQQVVDEQVRKLIDLAHDDVTELISGHRDQLTNLAQALLKEETLDENDAYAAAGIAGHTVKLEEAEDEPEPIQAVPPPTPTPVRSGIRRPRIRSA
jgi:cell division protease FtsH